MAMSKSQGQSTIKTENYSLSISQIEAQLKEIALQRAGGDVKLNDLQTKLQGCIIQHEDDGVKIKEEEVEVTLVWDSDGHVHVVQTDTGKILCKS